MKIYPKPKVSYGGPDCNCGRCGGIAEGYMLQNDIWKAAAKYGERFLCIECAESRLGNSLSKKSFIKALINEGIFGFDSNEYLDWKKENNP